MEEGDFDQDGDIDLMLGAFILPMDKEFVAIQDLWRDNKVDLMFLENQFK